MAKCAWIDISNTPQVPFFSGLLPELHAQGFTTTVTLREKNETVPLAKLKGLEGKAIGRDYDDGLRKAGAMALRTAWLGIAPPRFDVSIAFENPMAIPAAWARRKPSVIILDNDLKLDDAGTVQRMETRVKRRASLVIVPDAMHEQALTEFPAERVVAYPGIKEHVHRHGFEPASTPPVPLTDYVVVRPEAFDSKYVGQGPSLVPSLVRTLSARGQDVVLLDRQDRFRLAKLPHVHIPKTALDGLNLIYHARAILTGSGTMAREGVALGVPAVSFFPGRRLLAVDAQLVERRQLLHSRDVAEIAEYVRDPSTLRRPIERDATRKVLRAIIGPVVRLAG